MSSKNKSWFQAYQKLMDLWNLQPDWMLLEYLHLLPKGPVLDLGSGNGRNGLLFALMGRHVDFVDTSKTFSRRLKKWGEAEGLDISAFTMDVREFEIPKREYALIIGAKIMQLFRTSDSTELAERIQNGLARKGLVYIYTFSAESLEHIEITDEMELVEKNTYYHSRYKLHFHYFTRDEFLGLFPKLKTLCYTQGLRFDLSRKRYNGPIEFVGQRMR